MRMPPANTQSCAMCGGRASNLHERLNRSRGGPRDEFNTRYLCGSGTTGCHGYVTGNPAWAIANGWTVSGFIDRDGRYCGPDEDYRRHYGDGRLGVVS